MSCFNLVLLLLLSHMVLSQLHPAERAALLLLRDSLTSPSDLHGNWTGPPCIHSLSRWKGITCSNWHVVQIVLEGFQLLGYLPPAFPQNITFLTQLNLRNNSISGTLPNLTNLVFLEHVLLSYNRFYGSIPVEYVGLPGLKELELQKNYLDGQIPPFDQASLTNFNVSYNHLVGPIPQTSVLQKFPKSSFDNNSDLCGKPLDILCPAPSPSPPYAPAPSPATAKENKRFPVWIIAVMITGPTLVLLLIIIVFFFCNKRNQLKETTRNYSPGYGFGAWAKNMMSYSLSTEDPERSGILEIYSKELPIFDLDDLLRASAEILGKGNIGTTYKATFETGAVVAVKRLDHMNGLGKKEFLQHMKLQAKLKHENLVEVISFYYSDEEKLAVYEFIPCSSSLFELIHGSRGVGRTPLNWSTRLAIIKDIAKGLAFLHHSLPSQKVPHANLRTSNVLIRQDARGYNLKLTDFGFLPLLSAKKGTEKLAISKSPEFVQGKKLTRKADVYCFGIIILEVITGKVPGESLGEIEETTSDIAEWVRTVVNSDWSTDILDAEILAAREGHGAMFELTEIALQCTDMTPERRPKMNEVLARIEGIE
ncbi:leucine-rich repeat receptor-like protein kinase PXC1 [Prosopis cineraria]|uniref:leucine-rich repeat receptor-like protein kinase PXC1 n=1 Tax=Prosopis cineraria TaxID=364024 RepID=UPI00240EA37A|nr:leucine-rich repeat receptor-like protein kinase PXC1 [Prosopis cineraria]